MSFCVKAESLGQLCLLRNHRALVDLSFFNVDFKNDLFYFRFCIYMGVWCVCVCGYVHLCKVSVETEEGIRLSGAEVTGCCEPPVIGAGTKCKSCKSAGSAPSH